MSIARFRIFGQLDFAGGRHEATVTVNRETGLVTIRPLRRRKAYETTLGVLCDMFIQRSIHAELREKAAKKKRGRK